jgi:chromosomal replication initiation ATPase DnaA
MRQIPLILPHNAAMGADDFLVTPSNQDAVAWIEKYPDWPAHGLIVTGAAGSGKSHLLNLWVSQNDAAILSAQNLSASDFSASAALPRIAIDNVDGLAGDLTAEENLFHLYNHLKSSGGSLLLTMTRGAGQAGFALPDLRSRLLTLPTASLGVPDDDLLAALIIKQFRDRQVALDAGVVAYIVPRAARDADAIRDLVEKLDHAALAEGRKVSISLARRILGASDE